MLCLAILFFVENFFLLKKMEPKETVSQLAGNIWYLVALAGFMLCIYIAVVLW